MQLFFIHTDMQ